MATVLCQECIERQLEPKEAIGLWKNLPICDDCLEGIMKNEDDFHFETKDKESSELTWEEKKKIAFECLDKLEELYSKWPLKADETLQCHEDFYNHKPPAIINCSLEEIEEIYKRRKGILYAVRHKDERWATDINLLKSKLREEANLSGVTKSKKEIGKKVRSTDFELEKQKKEAKALGLSIERYQEILSKGREQKFEKLVGQKKDTVPSVYPPVRETTGDILKNLQAKVKTKPASVRIHPATGKPIL